MEDPSEAQGGRSAGSAPIPRRPEVRVDRWLRPFSRFLRIEAASGGVLLGCAIVALIAANSPLADVWDAVWHVPVVLSVGTFALDWSLAHWVNDGLMTIFFFVVGLEIKREFVIGRALPVIMVNRHVARSSFAVPEDPLTRHSPDGSSQSPTIVA